MFDKLSFEYQNNQELLASNLFVICGKVSINMSLKKYFSTRVETRVICLIAFVKFICQAVAKYCHNESFFLLRKTKKTNCSFRIHHVSLWDNSNHRIPAFTCCAVAFDTSQQISVNQGQKPHMKRMLIARNYECIYIQRPMFLFISVLHWLNGGHAGRAPT